MTSSPNRRLPDFVDRFLALEAAGGILLLAATVVAVGWASSPWAASYVDLAADAHPWVNDGLMPVFFLVIGMELRRELTTGQLASWRAAVVPAAGALGGMVVPALLFAACNAGGPGGGGWGIPMATDVAFAVGVLALVGSRVPPELKVLLLALAVVDDIGAVGVIAVFYGGGLHATTVAVVLGLLLPPGRLEDLLHPWTSYVVVPLFALANAGVAVSWSGLGAAAESAVAQGIVVGLVLGKLAGIAGGILLAVRSGAGRLPAGITTRHVLGLAALGGIGFTVSIVVTDRAFATPSLVEEAKIGILVASLVAAAIGAGILGRGPAAPPPE